METVAAVGDCDERVSWSQSDPVVGSSGCPVGRFGSASTRALIRVEEEALPGRDGSCRTVCGPGRRAGADAAVEPG